jgi:hypothetical protein
MSSSLKYFAINQSAENKDANVPLLKVSVILNEPFLFKFLMMKYRDNEKYQ